MDDSRGLPSPSDRQIPAWAHAVGPGWATLLDQLHRDLLAPHRRRPRQELTVRQRSLNKAHAGLRYPVERGIARLKTWRIFRKAHCSPNWLTTAAQAVLILESYR
ncbi:hypothetical protein I5Q34_09535 [Streptomyces sp. AV19]|uniref:transposase family protein n=1 Tax=Streptomyces sp. AV19 TaxID=2793068 RepID=UPI0018FECF8F|nr:transposase family protein [Streptomyces sp. AV19]MBH1934526.1 hypothetical protein [Streptomyces sp. AV19]MDG4536950.1 transposase family protein [Streptomyces sp. AV19]